MYVYIYIVGKIVFSSTISMHDLIPSRYFPNYKLRHSRTFVPPQTKTISYFGRFILALSPTPELKYLLSYSYIKSSIIGSYFALTMELN